MTRPTALVALLVALSACGGDSGPTQIVEEADPTVPASINLLPQQGLLTFIGDTIRFSARVLNAQGQGLPNPVSWSSSDPAIVSVGAAGDATAIANGTAQVRATSGPASAEVEVVVSQLPTSMEIQAGDGQTGVVGRALEEPIQFRVVDEAGSPIIGLEVTFSVSEGGGEISPSPATTDELGTVEATWTAGASPGIATATVVSGESALGSFTANIIGIPDLRIAQLITDPESPTTDQTVDVLIEVENAGLGVNTDDAILQLFLDGELIAFRPTGQVQAESTATLLVRDLDPFTDAGTRTLTAVVDSGGDVEETDEENNEASIEVEVVTATAIVPDEPLAGLTGTANEQQFFTVEVSPGQGEVVAQLDVTLAGGSGNADLYVKAGTPPSVDDFDAQSTNAGNAESVSIADPDPGTYHILVDAASAFTDATLSSSLETSPDPGTYDIEIVFISPVTDEQRAAFEEAVTIWEAALAADLIAVDFGTNTFPASACRLGQPEVVDVVDDLRIFMLVEEVDGPFGILASAGPCAVRSGGGLPVLGGMRFDVADVDRQLQNGSLVATIVHEIGHVLGIGTRWNSAGLLVDPSSSDEELDTHFIGERAIAAFEAAGGEDYPGAKVPVANVGGGGSINSHWRESVLVTELMTPSINSGSNPLSAISIESLADIGYAVDVSAADDYALPGSSGAALTTTATPLERLVGDVLRMPIHVVDPDGRVLRVIRPR